MQNLTVTFSKKCNALLKAGIKIITTNSDGKDFFKLPDLICITTIYLLRLLRPYLHAQTKS